MSALKGIAAAAALAAGGLLASSASAAPFLNVNVVGRIQGSGEAFGSQVQPTAVGQVVEYEVRILLGAEGATNQHAGAATTRTITDWVPSNGGTSPTAGLNNLRFSLTQVGDAGTIQSNFSSGVVGQSTGGGSWGAFLGSSPGTVTARGNGNSNLINAGLVREPGNFDGISADGLTPKVVTVAVGTFTIASLGTQSAVTLDLTGVPTGTIAGYRWQNASGSAVNYTQTLAHQTSAVANGDPISTYGSLALIVPEPATAGVLALAGLAAAGLRTRRRAR